ncbi:cell division protein, partial [Lactobacillaceae bacterium KNUT 0156]|nr:cell division protein [Weissella cibaria]
MMADKTTQNDKSSSDIQAHLDALLSEEDWSSLRTRRTGKSGADEVADAANFSANGYDDDDVEANLLRAKPRFDPSTRRLYQHER